MRAFTNYLFLNNKKISILVLGYLGNVVYYDQNEVSCFSTGMSIVNAKDLKSIIYDILKRAESFIQNSITDFILVLDDCRTEFKTIEIEKNLQTQSQILKKDILKLEQKAKEISLTEDFEVFAIKPSYVVLDDTSLHFYIPYDMSCSKFLMGITMMGFDSVVFNSIKYILNECSINILKTINSIALTALCVFEKSENFDVNSWKSVLYIGSDFSTLLVFRGDCFCFFDTIDVGFVNILEQISQYLDIQYGDAEDVFDIAVKFNQSVHGSGIGGDSDNHFSLDNKTLHDTYDVIQRNVFSIVNTCVNNINSANKDVLKRSFFDVVLSPDISSKITPIELIKLDSVTTTLKCFHYNFNQELKSSQEDYYYKKNDLHMECSTHFLTSFNRGGLKINQLSFRDFVLNLIS